MNENFTSKSEGLTREKAVILLAMGRTKRDVKSIAGISNGTLNKLLAEDAFQKEVEQQRKNLMKEFKARTLSLAPIAFDTLKKVMKGPNHSAAIRAASLVLVSIGALGEPEKALDTTKKVLQLSFVPKKSTGTDE